jgi:hypothetical protein
MSDVWACTVPMAKAAAIFASPIAFHSHPKRPEADAIGKVVMLASLSMVVGCAKLAGFVLREGSDPRHEHPEADRIRLEASRHDGPVIWVFENAIGFDEPIAMKCSGGPGLLFTLPERLHAPLREAYRKARERRKA